MPDTTALANANWSGAVFCATRCYPCQFDECPGEPHTWGSPEDFAHAWATFQDAPGFCGCECGRPKRTTNVRVYCLSQALRLWEWSCPRCRSGKATGWRAAVEAADAHRASDECKHRRAAP